MFFGLRIANFRWFLQVEPAAKGNGLIEFSNRCSNALAQTVIALAQTAVAHAHAQTGEALALALAQSGEALLTFVILFPDPAP